MPQYISVIVYKGRSAIPTEAITQAGYYLAVEPIFLSNLTVAGLTQALRAAIAQGHPVVPTPTREDFKRRKDPVLLSLQAKNWKALAASGASYGIEWQEDSIRVSVSGLDRHGRFIDDAEYERRLPTDTNLEEIAQIILDDLHRREMII